MSSDTLSISATSTTPITSTDDNAMGGSMDSWIAPGTSTGLPALPAAPASSNSNTAVTMAVPIGTPRDTGTPRGRGPALRKTVGSPGARSQSSTAIQRENERLRKENSTLKRDLAAEQSMSQSRLDVILHQQQEEKRKMSLALAQSQHIARAAAEEHAEAVQMKQHYEDAQKGASAYAQSAWNSHEQAEQYADRCIKLAEESFKRQNLAEAAAHDARMQASQLAAESFCFDCLNPIKYVFFRN